MMKNENIIVLCTWSGGKDSQASLIWTLDAYPLDRYDTRAVFCDTGWEHELTYKHVQYVTSSLGVSLSTIRSKKYNGMVDLALQKGRFASRKARFCTEKLKVEPMIDYILDECKNNVLVIQGIRADESADRAKMSKFCTFFKYYFEPYGYDKKGKPKYYYYRKKEVVKWLETYTANVYRPVLEKTAQEVIQISLDAGLSLNDLYYMGASRVGCYPCNQCQQVEIKNMIEHAPEYIERLDNAEIEVGRSFFPPDYIPKRYNTGIDTKTGKTFPWIRDIVRYLKDKQATGQLFKEHKQPERRCMSAFHICE
jgi:3'-phosphoadenosine 5'-phosphosulfate sulfotransferase (PAPS reductase)/FAD synthetase